ncbi:MAG: PfkB family carbohydrate kinase, partial [Solirubrobacteraceae bacterium]
ELSDLGIAVHAARREGPTRRVVTLLERGGERTIITLGERLAPHGDDQLPWERLDGARGAYLTAGDPGAVRHARRAGVLVVTPRIREGLGSGSVAVDALVFSARDRDERAWADSLADSTRLMVATDGERGGRWWGETEGRWEAVAAPGPPRDSYGCGDAFAAGFTFGLATGRSVAEAAAIGARCGAAMLARVGAP